MLRRLICTLLALVMMFSCFFVLAFAEEADTEIQVVENNSGDVNEYADTGYSSEIQTTGIAKYTEGVTYTFTYKNIDGKYYWSVYKVSEW